MGLSEFVYCQGYNYYGISDRDGNSAKGKPNFRLDLFPQQNLSRRTIRSLLETDPGLTRAMGITAEMCMMRNLWHDLEEGLLCTPAELYNDLLKKGYDWEILLDTRGFWLPLEETGPHAKRNFLSTMDLLNMRATDWKPKWYDKAVKEKNKAAGKVEEAKPTANQLMDQIKDRQAAKKT